MELLLGNILLRKLTRKNKGRWLICVKRPYGRGILLHKTPYGTKLETVKMFICD
jgi:hypothetical protein